MKVYELINELARMPAGDIVKFRHLASENELSCYTVVDKYYELELVIS